MKRDIETLRYSLREALLSGDDTRALRADIARLESEQHRAAAQAARSAADRAAIADEALSRDACARVAASASRLKTLLTSLQPED